MTAADNELVNICNVMIELAIESKWDEAFAIKETLVEYIEDMHADIRAIEAAIGIVNALEPTNPDACRDEGKMPSKTLVKRKAQSEQRASA